MGGGNITMISIVFSLYYCYGEGGVGCYRVRYKILTGYVIRV